MKVLNKSQLPCDTSLNTILGIRNDCVEPGTNIYEGALALQLVK